MTITTSNLSDEKLLKKYQDLKIKVIELDKALSDEDVSRYGTPPSKIETLSQMKTNLQTMRHEIKQREGELFSNLMLGPIDAILDISDIDETTRIAHLEGYISKNTIMILNRVWPGDEFGKVTYGQMVRYAQRINQGYVSRTNIEGISFREGKQIDELISKMGSDI